MEDLRMGINLVKEGKNLTVVVAQVLNESTGGWIYTQMDRHTGGWMSRWQVNGTDAWVREWIGG